jgi:hypothetical protein
VALSETGQQEDDAALARRLEETAAALDALVARAAAPEPIAPVAATEEVEAAPEPVTAVEELETPSEPIMPAEAVPDSAVEQQADEEASVEEAPDLAGSWARYERYVDVLGLEEPSLDTLLSGPPADPRAAVPAPPVERSEPETAPVPPEPAPVIPEAQPPEPAPEPPPAAAEEEEELVPISDLCYSGTAALERARSLGEVIRAGLAAGHVSADLRDLVEEVLDLVELGHQG